MEGGGCRYEAESRVSSPVDCSFGLDLFGQCHRKYQRHCVDLNIVKMAVSISLIEFVQKEF